ncbi:hypothetical protein PVAP13_4KG201962 [Panicum virgatum]|uniref:Uncharacterized protein n=1 Tax=Panicum virgatum TaxID=38727 RepID=A0A8T0TI65_PANVG|nr:hypothetical protein PVAP13_4KG201962 [Panicum virgatum]
MLAKIVAGLAGPRLAPPLAGLLRRGYAPPPPPPRPPTTSSSTRTRRAPPRRPPPPPPPQPPWRPPYRPSCSRACSSTTASATSATAVSARARPSSGILGSFRWQLIGRAIRCWWGLVCCVCGGRQMAALMAALRIVMQG